MVRLFKNVSEFEKQLNFWNLRINLWLSGISSIVFIDFLIFYRVLLNFCGSS